MNVSITNDRGESLQLSADQALVTEQNVAWLSDDELPAEYSFPLEIPLNENNRRFVQSAYRPDLARPLSQMMVTVKMEGVLYRRCTFVFKVNSGKLSGYLRIDSSEFYDKIRKMTLLEALPDQVAIGDGLISTPPVPLQTRLAQIAALPPGQFPCTFFPIRNQGQIEEGFDNTKLAGFVRNDYFNAWEPLTGGGFGFPIDLPNMPKFGYLICPQFYLSYVLERIMTLAGYSIQSEWLYSPEVQQITIKNLTAMSMALNGLGGFIEGHIITAGMFLPDTTVSDFLKAVKGRFGLVFTFNSNSKVCRITQFTQAVAKGPAIDLTPFQTSAYSTDYSDGKGFSVSDFVDSGDQLYNDTAGNPIAPSVQVTGLGQTQVSLRAGTCQLAYEKSPLGENCFWPVPTVRQLGNLLDPNYKQSSTFLTKEGKRPNSVGICFLSYRGMTTDTGGHPYPLGTPDIRNGQQAIVGAQALTLSGRSGSWRSYLRAYYYFRDQTQPVTQPLLLPASILASLQLDRSVMLSLEDQIKRSYLISKVQAEAPGTEGKVIVQLEVLTIPPGIDQPRDEDSALVWVELIVVATGLISPPGGIYPAVSTKTANLTVKIWADQSRTMPALVTNLPVVIRQKKSYYNNASPYQESLATYLASGLQTILEPALRVYENIADGFGNFTNWTMTASLDPGEGYNILI